MDPELIEILRCPACHAEVRLRAEQSGIACLGCGRVYPVRDGIPVMLVEEATSPTEPDGSGGSPGAPKV